MGEVYRARDTRLDREVAIKVLPRAISQDPDRIERFEREARAAAALHHPNVVVTLDAGFWDGVHFIVTELLDGNTLREELARGKPQSPERAIRTGAQLARGLAAAHAHGIVHRDLKPENIVVTSEGVPKIIDFGLARVEPASAAANEATASLTQPGAVMGTIGYMAPEQVRGLTADHRADIFALGAILYELITGRRAFAAATSADTLAAILSQEIAPADLESRAPPALVQVVIRCLEKQPEVRFQSASDLAFALEMMSGAMLLPAAPVADADRARTRGRRRRAAYIAVLGAGFVAAGAALYPDPVPRVGGYTQLTRTPLFFPPFPSEYPLVTDGPRVYFTEWVNGRLVVAQAAVSGGDVAPIQLSLGRDHLVDAISPDGTEALIGTPEPGTSEEQFYVLPLVAGPPRRLPDVVAHGTSWLGDGRILYTRGSEVLLADSDGTGGRALFKVPGRAYWLRLSPDRARVRFTLFRHGFRYPSLWEAKLDGSGLKQILSEPSEPSHECCGEWTTDGRYYVFQATRRNASHIWAIREPAGSFSLRTPRPVQLTSGPVQFRRVVPGRDGRRLFAIGWHLRGELTRIGGTSGGVEPHLAGLSAEWVAYARNGQWLAYVTYPEEELWRARPDGSQAQRLTTSPMRSLMPSWSPDARWIAFAGDRGDAPAVFVVSAEGGVARRVVEGRSPSWSPDGRSLAYETGGVIKTVTLHSGKAVTLVAPTPLGSPAWSPDGRHLAAIRPPAGNLQVCDLADARWSDLVTDWTAGPVWSRDGKHIYFLHYRGFPVVRSVSRVRVADGHVEPVVNLQDLPLVWGAAGFWLGLTPDDEPLILRDRSRHDLYALDWRKR
jgi:hypothetical protein